MTDDSEEDLHSIRANLIPDNLENVYALTEVGSAITDSNAIIDSSFNYSLQTSENNEGQSDPKTLEIISKTEVSIIVNNEEQSMGNNIVDKNANNKQFEQSGTSINDTFNFLNDQSTIYVDEKKLKMASDTFDGNQEQSDIKYKISHKAATAPETQPTTSLLQSPSETSRKIHTLYSDPIDFSELQPLETTPELDSLCKQQMKQFMHKNSLPENSQQQRLIQYVQRQKVNAIVSNNYKEAAKLQTTFQNLLSLINETQQRESLQAKTKEITKKIGEVCEKIEEIKHETEDIIINEKNRLNLKREDILNQHHFDMMQFEGKWNDEEYLRRFTKPSSQLLKKQTLLHSYILMKNFEKAEELRIEIEAMEISESETAQKRAEFEMSKEQLKIIQKQQNEIETFDDYCQRQIEMTTRDQEAKMTPLLARQKKLESELNYLKNMKVSTTSLLPTLQTASAPASSLDHVMTPRTVQRYSSYKTQIRNPRLTVKPLGSIIKGKKKNNFK